MGTPSVGPICSARSSLVFSGFPTIKSMRFIVCLDNLVGRYVQHGNRLLRLYNRLVGRALNTLFLNASWIFSLTDVKLSSNGFRTSPISRSSISQNHGPSDVRRVLAAGTSALSSWGFADSYCSFAYSVLASFRMGTSGSASFHSARKSL